MIAIVGTVTAFFAATIAVAQHDIKKVLAYSTISQLGYMFMAVGSEAYVAAVFHMITHAFFKGLLFLSAGSVIHGMHDDQDMRHMGALRKVMPITSACFIVGWLAIAGVPPFSGFWSKDEILAFVWEKSPILWFVGVVTALLTAYYMTRQVILVFFGKERWDEARPTYPEAPVEPSPTPLAVGAAVADDVHDHEGHTFHPHESPWIMTTPLVILAFFAATAGVLNLPIGHLDFLHQWLESVPFLEETLAPHTTSTAEELLLIFVSVAFVGVGIFLAYLVYARHRIKAVEPDAARARVVRRRGRGRPRGRPGSRRRGRACRSSTTRSSTARSWARAPWWPTPGAGCAGSRPACSGSTPSASASARCSCSAGSCWRGCSRWSTASRCSRRSSSCPSSGPS